ncbi:2519_t:CDS:2, partial [Entrophospora sp. SA101]
LPNESILNSFPYPNFKWHWDKSISSIKVLYNSYNSLSFSAYETLSGFLKNFNGKNGDVILKFQYKNDSYKDKV